MPTISEPIKFFNVVDANKGWTTVYKGTKGDDVFITEPAEIVGPVVLIGGDGNDTYNLPQASEAALQYAATHPGQYLGIVYHGVLKGFGWPSWATYGTSDTITGTNRTGREVAHGGDGTFTNLAGDNDGRNGKFDGDDFVYHGTDHDGLIDARLVFSARERDRVFMSNSDKLDPRDDFGANDGFRFHDARWAVIDSNTVQITYAELTAYALSSFVDDTTLELLMTNPAGHGKNFVPELVDFVGTPDGEVYTRLASYLPGGSGPDLIL
jgi:hypothetical protein